MAHPLSAKEDINASAKSCICDKSAKPMNGGQSRAIEKRLWSRSGMTKIAKENEQGFRK
jgi:hypothetical protein